MPVDILKKFEAYRPFVGKNIIAGMEMEEMTVRLVFEGSSQDLLIPLVPGIVGFWNDMWDNLNIGDPFYIDIVDGSLYYGKKDPAYLRANENEKMED
ncbi:MAG: hypothetical protein ABI758_04980 [Candidatus Woesebacteria bacterium]